MVEDKEMVIASTACKKEVIYGGSNSAFSNIQSHSSYCRPS